MATSRASRRLALPSDVHATARWGESLGDVWQQKLRGAGCPGRATTPVATRWATLSLPNPATAQHAIAVVEHGRLAGGDSEDRLIGNHGRVAVAIQLHRHWL